MEQDHSRSIMFFRGKVLGVEIQLGISISTVRFVVSNSAGICELGIPHTDGFVIFLNCVIVVADSISSHYLLGFIKGILCFNS